MNGSGWPGVHGNPAPVEEGPALFPREGRNAPAETWGAREVGLVACLLPLLAGVWTWVAWGADGVTFRAAWVALALGAGGWVAALFLARGARESAALLLVVASGAAALRLPFLAAEPELSDDVHRYVWEGALVGAGVDPYAHPPDAPELAPYRERWPETSAKVDHRGVGAAYPPLAQAVHAGLVAAAGGAEHHDRARTFLRLFYATCDLLVCVPLAWLLARARRSRALLVAWAWNPWVAFEFAGSGHLDALAILCLVGGLACLPRRVPTGGFPFASALALLAAGGAVKVLPAALFPFVLRRTHRPLRWGFVFVLACALACLPFVLSTGSLPGSGGLDEYAFRWESFSLFHRGLEPQFARVFEYDRSWSDPRRLARAVEIALWLGLGAYAWRRRFGPARAAMLLVGGWLVLSPVLHPWYLTWIVPFLALRPS